MASPNENQTGNSKDLDQTVKLMRCDKHGVSFYFGENCPECEKEKKSGG